MKQMKVGSSLKAVSNTCYFFLKNLNFIKIYKVSSVNQGLYVLLERKEFILLKKGTQKQLKRDS